MRHVTRTIHPAAPEGALTPWQEDQARKRQEEAKERADRLRDVRRRAQAEARFAPRLEQARASLRGARQVLAADRRYRAAAVAQLQADGAEPGWSHEDLVAIAEAQVEAVAGLRELGLDLEEHTERLPLAACREQMSEEDLAAVEELVELLGAPEIAGAAGGAR